MFPWDPRSWRISDGPDGLFCTVFKARNCQFCLARSTTNLPRIYQESTRNLPGIYHIVRPVLLSCKDATSKGEVLAGRSSETRWSTKVFVVPGDNDDHWLWSPRSLHEWLLAGSVCAFAKNGGLRWCSMWFGFHLRFWASLFLSGSMVRCSRINQAFLFHHIWSSTCKPTETDTFDDAFKRFSLNQTASKQSTTELSSEQMTWQRDEITLVAEIKWQEFVHALLWFLVSGYLHCWTS